MYFEVAEALNLIEGTLHLIAGGIYQTAEDVILFVDTLNLTLEGISLIAGDINLNVGPLLLFMDLLFFGFLEYYSLSTQSIFI